MIIKLIKDGYIINLTEKEVFASNVINKKNKPLQKINIIKLTSKIIKQIGINHTCKSIKICIAKKNNFLSILILPTVESYSTVALKLKTEKELLTISEQLYKNKCSKSCISSVYIYNENYYLTITPITKSKRTVLICKEFCFDIIKDLNEILNIQKLGNEICSIDAIDKLGEAISK